MTRREESLTPVRGGSAHPRCDAMVYVRLHRRVRAPETCVWDSFFVRDVSDASSAALRSRHCQACRSQITGAQPRSSWCNRSPIILQSDTACKRLDICGNKTYRHTHIQVPTAQHDETRVDDQGSASIRIAICSVGAGIVSCSGAGHSGHTEMRTPVTGL